MKVNEIASSPSLSAQRSWFFFLTRHFLFLVKYKYIFIFFSHFFFLFRYNLFCKSVFFIFLVYHLSNFIFPFSFILYLFSHVFLFSFPISFIFVDSFSFCSIETLISLFQHFFRLVFFSSLFLIYLIFFLYRGFHFNFPLDFFFFMSYLLLSY